MGGVAEADWVLICCHPAAEFLSECQLAAGGEETHLFRKKMAV